MTTPAAVPTTDAERPAARWWREWEIALLTALVAALYLSRVGALPITGEEPRRAQVAFEMQFRGDWVVPREQGDPFLSRPPLQNWLIAAACWFFDSRDGWAVRLPSVLATLLTTLLIYIYGRTFLSRLGALAAGVIFATFGELLQTGRQAETEATFIALLSASLLVWHWGVSRGWPDALTWSAAYGLSGLAVLTKGPQAPVYLIGTLILYLLLTKQARRLFTAGHAVGVAVGVFVVAAWAVPCYRAVGWVNLLGIVMNDSAARLYDWKLGEVAAHFATFPLELLGCLLPWSLLLPAYALRQFRQTIGPARQAVLFLGLTLVVALPSCWIPPGGQTRFLAPLYPCLALLIGLVVQRVAESSAESRLAAGWRRFLGVVAGATLLAALATAVGPLLPLGGALTHWPAPAAWAVGYGVALAGLATIAWRLRSGCGATRVRAGVLTVAAVMGLLLIGVVTDFRQRRGVYAGPVVRELLAAVPERENLVSFNHVDALFVYHSGRPIDWRPWPESAADVPADVVYFCFDWSGVGVPPLPFAWSQLAAIPMDRTRSATPERVVVVGRRMAESAQR